MPAMQPAMLGLVCVRCDTALTEDNRGEEDLNICQDCIEDYYAYCERCGIFGATEGLSNLAYRRILDRYGRVEASRYLYMNIVSYYEDGDITLCSDCVHCCPHCDTVFAYEDNANECCEDDSTLHYYSWQPLLIFHTELGKRHAPIPGRLYMGMEVEMERAASLARDAINHIDEDYWAPQYLYFKSDGSLYDNGAEMVTQPMTLEAFRTQFPWQILEFLHSRGARAWAMSNCGLHVHVSRSAFSPSHLWKFIKFQTVNSNYCATVAGRDSEQWASWTNDYMSEVTKSPSKAVKRSVSPSRYSAINIMPRETVELRYFRPNLNADGLLRVAEFVDSMYEYTKQLTVRDIVFNGMRWDNYVQFIADKEKYQTINKYINRLFNNDEENI